MVKTAEKLAVEIIGLSTDRAFDMLLEADIKWKIAAHNGKKCIVSDEGTRVDRLLVETQEETVHAARVG